MKLTKYKSETIRKGEPDDHEYAVKLVCMWLSTNYVDFGPVTRTYSTTKTFFYPKEFRTAKDYPLKHSPDITLHGWKDVDDPQAVEHIFGFIEVDGKLGIEYTDLRGNKKKSTPTRHDKPKQKINDHIFEEYAKQYYGVKVLRVLKEEILTDNKEDRERYLNKRLGGLKK